MRCWRSPAHARGDRGLARRARVPPASWPGLAGPGGLVASGSRPARTRCSLAMIMYVARRVVPIRLAARAEGLRVRDERVRKFRPPGRLRQSLALRNGLREVAWPSDHDDRLAM